MKHVTVCIDTVHSFYSVSRTWQDISAHIDNPVITMKGMSTDCKSAISTFNFDLRYDSALFAILQAKTSVSLIKASIDGVGVFCGYFRPFALGEYDGIPKNQSISIECEDLTTFLDVKVNPDVEDFSSDYDSVIEVALKDYKLCDPSDPSNSVIHSLFTKIGIPLSFIDPSFSDTQICPAVVNESETESYLTILSTLLYELGYVLHWSGDGLFSPLRWILPATSEVSFTFNESNSILESSDAINDSDYEGTILIWYSVATASKVSLYEADLPYDTDGSWEGYCISADEYYPTDASAIDYTTGALQKVYQEYQNTGVQYRASAYGSTSLTTKGNTLWSSSFVESHSDFSSILITQNHTIEDKYDSGITRDVTKFFNKKARVRYHNTTTSETPMIYYMDILADVTYRSAERKLYFQLVTGTTKLDSYKSRFIFTENQAKTFGGALALCLTYKGRKTYTEQSLSYLAPGSFVGVSKKNGVAGAGLISEVKFDATTEIYTYQIKGLI